MQASFKIIQVVRIHSAWLCGLSLFCLTVRPAPGRPIEFSEPAGTNLATQVSTLGAKPADLPPVEDRVFKPHSFHSDDSLALNMKPVASPSIILNNRKNRTPGVFDRDNDWANLSPDKILLKQMERDALKLPSLDDAENDLLDTGSSWDPFNLKSSRRNGSGKNGRARSSETNRLDSASEILTTTDPFASPASRRAGWENSPATEVSAARMRSLADLPHASGDLSPEAVGQRQVADHLEDFKRSLNLPAAGSESGLPAPGYQPTRGNALVSGSEGFSRSPAQYANPQLVAPVAPLAPQAPQVPGLSSLSPLPYAPPTKPKALDFSAPRRVF